MPGKNVEFKSQSSDIDEEVQPDVTPQFQKEGQINFYEPDDPYIEEFSKTMKYPSDQVMSKSVVIPTGKIQKTDPLESPQPRRKSFFKSQTVEMKILSDEMNKLDTNQVTPKKKSQKSPPGSPNKPEKLSAKKAWKSFTSVVIGKPNELDLQLKPDPEKDVEDNMKEIHCKTL